MLRGRGAEGRGAGRLGAQRAPRPGARRPLTASSPPADDGDDQDEGAGHGGAASRARALSTAAWSGTNGRLAEGEAAGARRGSWSRPPRSLRRRATVGEGRAEPGSGRDRLPVSCPGGSPSSQPTLREAVAALGLLSVDLHPGSLSADPLLHVDPPPSSPVPLSTDPPPARFLPPEPSFPPPPVSPQCWPPLPPSPVRESSSLPPGPLSAEPSPSSGSPQRGPFPPPPSPRPVRSRQWGLLLLGPVCSQPPPFFSRRVPSALSPPPGTSAPSHAGAPSPCGRHTLVPSVSVPSPFCSSFPAPL